MDFTFLLNYFQNPEWLLGLIGIIPVLAFYMLKPKPVQMDMPSYMFFEKDKESGRLKNAINMLKRNMLIFLNILAIIGLSVAMAGPTTTSQSISDETVVVIDASASMYNNFNSAKEFAKDHLGEQNTLIVVDNEIEVVMEEASQTRTASNIDNLDSKATSSEIFNALQIAQNYEGDMIIASDFVTQSDTENYESVIQQIDNQRNVIVQDTEAGNKIGFTDLEITPQKAIIEITNYQETEAQEIININEETTRTVEIPATSSRSIEVEIKPGENIIEIESFTGMPHDERIFIYKPVEENLEVGVVGGNDYVYALFDILDYTEPQRLTDFEEAPEKDLYYITPTGENDNWVERKDELTGKKIIESNQHLAEITHFTDMNFETKRTDIEIKEPIELIINDAEIYNFSTDTTHAYTEQGHTVFEISKFEDVLIYNSIDERFRYEFEYPIFWNHVLRDFMGLKSVQQANLETGEVSDRRLTGPQTVPPQEIIKQTGFYQDSEQKTYAVNFLDSRESAGNDFQYQNKIEVTESESSLNYLFVLLVLLLVSSELLYLMYEGDI